MFLGLELQRYQHTLQLFQKFLGDGQFDPLKGEARLQG